MKDEKSSSRLSPRLSSYGSEMSSEELGSLLQQRAVDVYEAEGQDIISRWLMAFKSHELGVQVDGQRVSSLDCMVVTMGSSELVRFQINFNGQVVDWQQALGVRTGFIVEEEPSVEFQAATSRMSFGDTERCVVEKIVFDKAINAESVSRANEIVVATTDLSIELRSAISIVLSGHSAGFIDSAGTNSVCQGRAPRSEMRPTFWSNVKRWAIG